MASQAFNWTGILQKPLDLFTGESVFDQAVPLLENLSTTSVTTLLATVLALVFFLARALMSRGSFANYYTSSGGGRSPYAAYAHSTTNDHGLDHLYGYVDEREVVLPPAYGHAPTFEDDNTPDVVHIRYRGETWSFEFPPYSIAEEKATVKHVRDRVATRLGLDRGEEGRIKLMYKDRELKWNDEPLRKYGCKQNSEISAMLLQETRDYNRRAVHLNNSDSDSHATSARSSKEEVRPHRSNSTYRRREPRDDEQRPNYANSRNLHPHDNHTPPGGTSSPRQPSPNRPNQQRAPRQPSPAPASNSTAPSSRSSAPAVQPPADPSTDLGKLQNARYEFHTQWVPLIDQFLRSPPSDREDRDKEYRRLNEIAYKRVFEVGDAIEPDGKDKEEIRATRKKLYAEAQDVLKDLDKFKPKDGK